MIVISRVTIRPETVVFNMFLVEDKTFIDKAGEL